MFKLSRYFLATICLTIAIAAFADMTVPMYFTAEKGVGASAGTIIITNTRYGLLFTPNLHGLTPGVHGFHIHQTASCENHAMAAGGHFDPKNTGKHLGPYNTKGHFGDLPVLYVNADGTATTPVLAPRLRNLTEIRNHALMIHEGSDNYSDTPQKLGGGAGRMVCGLLVNFPM